MTKEEFNKLWALIYPDTVPISYLFKHDYPGRWFRIHSLPESKRYAEDDDEWDILLKRQNEIITDLFGVGTALLLVTGDYGTGTEVHITSEEEVFKVHSFTRIEDIDLSKLNADKYDEGEAYRPAFAEVIWEPYQHDMLLREIANDNLRAFFLSFDKNIIVAPYDGGVDFLLKDTLTKEYYKSKYKQWLSAREDGY